MTPIPAPPSQHPLQAELWKVQQENAALRTHLAQCREAQPADPADVALENSPDRLRIAMEATRLTFWELDIPGGQVYLAPRWGAVSASQPGVLWQPVKAVLDQIHPDDALRVQQKLADYLQGRDARYLVKLRLQTSKGWAWIETMGLASQRDGAGRITRIVGTNADITAREVAQEELALAQARAENASLAKSEFLANMSHEVRTPLNAIMGLTRLLQKTPLNPEQANYLGLINTSATTLLALVNDVLDLSKIEAGKLIFEQVPFDLHDWIEQSISPLVAGARAKGLQVHLDIAHDLPHYLVGDPGRLRQVLSNLISNAVKFTEQGDIRVKVWQDPVQQDLQAGQLRVLFQVRDSGIGMSPAEQRGIFDAFTQADASTTRRFGGTGLGLAICQQLVQMMNGKIRVASEPGNGSIFRFNAVFSEAPSLPSELTMPAALEARSLEKIHVLLAEDHPVNQLLTRKLLEEFGCTVEVVANGLDAVARWRRGGIDLILMDVQMPVMSGEEATAIIRAEERVRQGHVSIVALTAHALAGDREKYLAAGMDAYASKPVSPETLARAMHAAVETSRPPTAEELLPFFNFAPGQARQAMPVVSSQTQSAGGAKVIDVARLLHILGGDEEALREVAVALREEIAHRLPCLQTAADTQDADLAGRHAHAMKGGLASSAIDRGAALAKDLERAAHDGNWVLFRHTLDLFGAELQRIDAMLQEMIAAP